MSTLLCGCDTESLWMCEEHRPKTGTVQQFKDRLEHADAMADTSATDGSVNVIIESRLPSLAEQFRVEAVRIAKQTPMPPNFKALTEGTWPSDPSPTDQFRAAAVATAAAVETRDDLLNRIATLEADLEHEQSRSAQRSNDYCYLLGVDRHEKEQLRKRIAELEADLKSARDRWALDALTVTRIAVILTRFYTEPLSLSSVQPLIALVLELNPDLVERAR